MNADSRRSARVLLSTGLMVLGCTGPASDRKGGNLAIETLPERYAPVGECSCTFDFAPGGPSVGLALVADVTEEEYQCQVSGSNVSLKRVSDGTYEGGGLRMNMKTTSVTGCPPEFPECEYSAMSRFVTVSDGRSEVTFVVNGGCGC